MFGRPVITALRITICGLLTALAMPSASAQSAAYVAQIGEVRTAAPRTASLRPAPATRAEPGPFRGNSATVTQQGDSNYASVVQQGGANAANLLQRGNDNLVRAQQQGYPGEGVNVMDVIQLGDSNRATLTQDGANNRLALTQNGAKEATITQNGSGTVNLTMLGNGPDSIEVNTDPGASVSVARYAGMAGQGGR